MTQAVILMARATLIEILREYVYGRRYRGGACLEYIGSAPVRCARGEQARCRSLLTIERAGAGPAAGARPRTPLSAADDRGTRHRLRAQGRQGAHAQRRGGRQ